MDKVQRVECVLTVNDDWSSVKLSAPQPQKFSNEARESATDEKSVVKFPGDPRERVKGKYRTANSKLWIFYENLKIDHHWSSRPWTWEFLDDPRRDREGITKRWFLSFRCGSRRAAFGKQEILKTGNRQYLANIRLKGKIVLI